MAAKTVFISHATPDKPFVMELQKRLEPLGIAAWVDARELTGGDLLDPEIRQAIDSATYFLVVFSAKTVNSRWVTKEVNHALERQRSASDNFKVVPLLLDGIEPSALHLWFGEEPLAIIIENGPDRLDKALPALLAALGERLPTYIPTVAPNPSAPVAELILELTDPAIVQDDNKRRAVADATLIYNPANPSERETSSKRYRFTAPLGPIETDDLKWYLESYSRWPTSVYLQRAQEIEKHLPEWGQALFAELHKTTGQAAFAAWEQAGKGVAHCFTIRIDRELTEGSPEAMQKEADEAATLLLALPWELLHDGRSYLFQGAQGVRVRRQLPNRYSQEPYTTNPPIRILLVSPRPDDGKVGYIDHRVSAIPLVEALAPLGSLADLTILTPPTFPALSDELARAKNAGQPYHVVHFDGHGVYDPKHGLGALVFEDPNDANKPTGRGYQLVDAKKIAESIRDCRVPLFFLEACQTAMSDTDPTASVAGKLLEDGVASVVAMTHSVLVETARRFVTAFYGAVLQGKRVGQAMLAGQRELHGDTWRMRTFAGDLHLHDWFVPVLYQEEHDPQIVASVPADLIQSQNAKEYELRLGNLPPVPPQTFVGRSRELLCMERMLHTRPYLTIVGEGGEGKTTLAAELARWLVRTERWARAAFVSFDKVTSADAALSEIGSQLVANYQSIAGQGDNRGWLAIERALVEQPTIIVLDNLESVLKPLDGAPGIAAFDQESLDKILALGTKLNGVGRTRLVFTSRESLPEPFAANVIRLGRLSDEDALKLVAKTLGKGERMPGTATDDASDEEIKKLIEAAGNHARLLVNVTREVKQKGVTNATAHLGRILRDLHTRYPNDREHSPIASVMLSLDRLPPETRRLIRPLGVFHKGASIGAIRLMLQSQDMEQALEVGRQLVGVGLATQESHDYLLFTPALALTLLNEMTVDEQEVARSAWVGTMREFARFIERQQFSNPEIAFGLAKWELSNLLAALQYQAKTAKAEELIEFAHVVENMAVSVGNNRAVVEAEQIRTVAAKQLRGWSHAAYVAQNAVIDRLLDRGYYADAVVAAEHLLEQSELAGEDAYLNAAFHIATAYFQSGRAMRMVGESESALLSLEEAERRLTALKQKGNQDAIRMTSIAMTEKANCSTDLGRFDEAAELYNRTIQEANQRGDPRAAVAGRTQLAAVRRKQRCYSDALNLYLQAKVEYEQLNEPEPVATCWHNIGMTYRKTGDVTMAGEAYINAIQIWRILDQSTGLASSLGELGNLYSDIGRFEEAVLFHRETATIFVELRDGIKEGAARNNVALAFLQLKRYEEARQELNRAALCNATVGHAAEPWKTFALMQELEQAIGDEAAAQQARNKAAEAFLAYRRSGGESTDNGSRLSTLVVQAISQAQHSAMASQLDKRLHSSETPEERKPFIRVLQRIVSGERDPALTDNPGLLFSDAVELRLLLETLAEQEAAPTNPPSKSQFSRTPRRKRPPRPK